MRSVSRATCTSVVPVSPSPWPKRATSSCLRSAVTVIRPDRSKSGADLPGPLHVAADLRHQLLDRGEQPLAAQALDEVDAKLRAIQVPFEVDQVGLDQHAAPGLELRAHADVDRRRAAV